MTRKICFAALVIFTVGLAFGGTITVTRPVRGTFAMGAICPVHWTANRVNGNVKIQLIGPGGALVGRLVNRLDPGSSPYNWTVANPAIAGESYRVRVSAVDNSAVGESEVFTIAVAGAPAGHGDPPLPAPAPRCDLGISRITYRNGAVIARIVNNGPDPLPLRDVKLSLSFPEVRPAEQPIIRQLAIPAGQQLDQTLAMVPPATIPNAGLLVTARIDAEGSAVSDSNPLNQQASKCLCLLDIRCEVHPADLVLTMRETPNGREYRVRYKVRVSHNLDRAVENLNVLVFVSDSGRRTRNAAENWTIPSIPPGVEFVRQVDRTYGELGRENAGQPVLCPGAEHRILVDLCELGRANCDIDFGNNQSFLTFSIPE